MPDNRLMAQAGCVPPTRICRRDAADAKTPRRFCLVDDDVRSSNTKGDSLPARISKGLKSISDIISEPTSAVRTHCAVAPRHHPSAMAHVGEEPSLIPLDTPGQQFYHNSLILDNVLSWLPGDDLINCLLTSKSVMSEVVRALYGEPVPADLGERLTRAHCPYVSCVAQSANITDGLLIMNVCRL